MTLVGRVRPTSVINAAATAFGTSSRNNLTPTRVAPFSDKQEATAIAVMRAQHIKLYQKGFTYRVPKCKCDTP
jgi:hypothetical protein